MKMIKVESSNIESIGYDGLLFRLRIKFLTSEKIYDFDGVPPDLHTEFIESDSKGKFFYKRIKGKFDLIK